MKLKHVTRACWAGALACVVCLFVLVGCTSFSATQPTMLRNTTKITVVESSNLPANVMGRAYWSADSCLVVLRQYPKCLQHEVRHCLEGGWHGDAPNGEDCHE